MTRGTRFVFGTVAAMLALAAGGSPIATPPAGADVASRTVDGLVQLHWALGIDFGSMDGTYTTSSQLGQGSMHETQSANFGGSVDFVFVRSDGMRMSGAGKYDLSNLPDIDFVVNLTGTSDIESASLELTQVSDGHIGPNSTGDAEFRVQGWIYPRRPWGGPRLLHFIPKATWVDSARLRTFVGSAQRRRRP
jgi:hypothetical protein